MGVLSKTTSEIEDALKKADNIEATFDTMFDTKFDTKFESEFNTNFNTKFDSEFNTKFTQKMLSIYPVGAIYMSVSSTSPASLFGGTWEQIENRFLLAAGSSYTAGNTGGEAKHTLTVSEMPPHQHKYRLKGGSNTDSQTAILNWYSNVDYQEWYTEKTGEGQPMNIMPPYLVVYVWKRTA